MRQDQLRYFWDTTLGRVSLELRTCAEHQEKSRRVENAFALATGRFPLTGASR